MLHRVWQYFLFYFYFLQQKKRNARQRAAQIKRDIFLKAAPPPPAPAVSRLQQDPIFETNKLCTLVRITLQSASPADPISTTAAAAAYLFRNRQTCSCIK